MNKHKQTGSASVVGIIIALVVIVGGGVIYMINSDQDKDSQSVTTETNSAQTEADTSAPAKPAAKPKSLPDDYPVAQAPIYQPSTIEMATGVGADNWLVSVLTPDDIAVVAETIMSDYEALGARVTQTPINEDGVGQIVASLGGYGTTITYNTDKDTQQTSISYNPTKQRQFD